MVEMIFTFNIQKVSPVKGPGLWCDSKIKISMWIAGIAILTKTFSVTVTTLEQR